MNKSMRSPWFLFLPTLLFGVMLMSGPLSGQQQPNQQQPPPSRTPDQGAQTAPDSQDQGQVFVGTIVKVGDKFMLQDTGGKSWDLDHQDLVKKYEGKQVKVTGTLDSDGKTIHMK
jgi:hypothetical protein